MTQQEAKQLIDSNPDFIHSKRFDNSLSKCLDRYPDGAPTKLIASSLLMSEDEVEALYGKVIRKLRNAMKVDVEQ